MERPVSTWPNTQTRFFNPIGKIRSLIQNLDAELMELCSQCQIPKSVAGISQNKNNNKNNQSIISPNSLLSTSSDSSGGVHIRTLSNIYRAKVIDAYRNRRIFTVYGNYHTIRRALLRRGWLEKLAPGRYPKLQGLSEDVLLQHARRGNDFEAVAISKIINHFPAFFIWQPKGFRDLHVDALPHRNRVRRGRNFDFSTKIGLIGCAEQEHWFNDDGLSGMSYPRFYRIGSSMEERTAFIEDFRRTQCRSLIRFIIENVNHPDDIIDEEDGTILPAIISFALTRIRRQLSDFDHNTLDAEIPDNGMQDWVHFITNSSMVLQRKCKFKASQGEIHEFAKVSKGVLEKLEEKRGDYKWDGCRNLWILKPGYQSRGIGIIIRSSLDEILQWASNNPNRKYIAQKYIERPLLIFKTKFDIRQYMLLTIGESKVTIWLYKDCYLRFSSQEFTIDDLRESIHLTNNSVQKRYKNKVTRDARLPKNNMWSLEQFKVYLKHQNAPEDVWNKKVYGGFRQNLVAVVLASFEETNFVENAFEMYGCDFMLDEQYNPILIEINSTPDLSPSTEVTARICPNALKDLVKVIVDLPRNSRAPTGQFDMVYEVNYKNKTDYDPQVGLAVNGKTMTINVPIRTNFRQRLMKKLLPAHKGKTQQKTVKKSGKETNVKDKQDKDQEQQSQPQQQKSPTSTDKIISKKTGNGTKLKAFAKEALALRYTLPK